MSDEKRALPPLTEVLFEAGLYVAYPLEGVEPEVFVRFMHAVGPVEGFCIWCDAPTMFFNPQGLPLYAKGRGPSATHHRFESIEDYLPVAPRRPPKIPHLWPPQTPPPELT